MLRVGLTGGLGSGKSTVAGILRELGAEVVESDALGRALMEPGQLVYSEIVQAFGPDIVSADGKLDRRRLAELAFCEGRLQELNAIVHPAAIELQRQWMEEVFERNPEAIAVVESALIFEVVRDAQARGDTDSILADWRRRIDRMIVVVAPDDLKIARYAGRIHTAGGGRASGVGWAAAEADARVRLSHQIPDAEKAAQADYVLNNAGGLADLRAQVEALWPRLQADHNKIRQNLSLE